MHLLVIMPLTSGNGIHRFAAKVIAKRWAPGMVMEPLFVKRMQHEVDICNHVGKMMQCHLHDPKVIYNYHLQWHQCFVVHAS